MPGRLGVRWVVLTSTDINFCSLLDLEDGILVKYDREFSFAFTPPLTAWFFDDTDRGVQWGVFKQAFMRPFSWSVNIFVAPS